MKEAKEQFSSIGLVLFLGTLIIYGVQILAGVVTKQFINVEKNRELYFLASMLPMYVIAYPIIFIMFKKVPVQISGEKKKMKPGEIILAFLIGYAGVYISNIVGNIITSIISVFKQGAVDNVLVDLMLNMNPIVLIFVVVICAPIMEELLFRKAIIDRTAKYGEGVSIVFSGLIFGLFHGNLNQFAYAFLLGIFFGFIYIKTKNIIYPIILHMITNFLGSIGGSIILEKSGILEIVEMLSSEISETEMMNVILDNVGGIILYFAYALCLFGLVIAGIIIFLINRKKFVLNAGEVTIEKGQRFKTVALNLGVGLFSIFWVVQIIWQLFE